MRPSTKPHLFILLIGITIASAHLPVFSQIQKDPGYPPAPLAIMDAGLRSIDGVSFTLSGHKGKVILIYLWGIWCGPNRAQFPRLVSLQQEYRDDGFEVIGLNIGNVDGKQETIRNIRKFATKSNLNFTLVQSAPGLTKWIFSLAQMEGIPLSVLIDREGRLRAVTRGGGPAVDQALEDVLRKIMREKK